MDDLPAEFQPEFQQRLEQEKLTALYQFAYGLSHEINNPLTNISARAQSLLATEKNPDRRRTLATIHTQALRAYEMVADLMLFARPPTPRKAPADLSQLMGDLVAEWQSAADAQGTALCWHPPLDAISADLDSQQIAVACGALVRNALEALGRGGEIAVSLDLDSQRQAIISVADSGPGIPPEVRRHLFDPYFSGREAGRGLGLGLSKCWRIVQLHGGHMEVDSPPTGGAILRIVLPSALA
jgi:signal transduction histidine kinase